VNIVSVYKRGLYYWYSFWFKGQRIQKGTLTSSRREAQKLEAVHKAKLIEGRLGVTNGNHIPRFSEFTGQYLPFSKANKRSYVAEVYYVTRTLNPFFGSLKLDAITPLRVEEFKQKRLRDGLKKCSINREVGLLKSMLSTAVKWELVERNGARDAKLFKLEDPLSDRVLSREEESKLLDACDRPILRYRAPHLKTVILIALYTGLRRGEIFRLRWADIDLETGFLTVRNSKTISGRGRRVNLNGSIQKTLQAMHQGSRSEWLFPSPERFQKLETDRHIGDTKHAFRKAVQLAAIPHITFHQLRHTFCSRLADAGVPLPVIQDLAGHASIIMTRRYTHPANELKQKAVELLLNAEESKEVATKSATPQSEANLSSQAVNGKVIQSKALGVEGELEKSSQTAT
jgi:integrase